MAMLVGGLHDSEVRVRRACARSLGLLGKSAADAVPELTRRLADEWACVRDAASVAMRQIQGGKGFGPTTKTPRKGRA